MAKGASYVAGDVSERIGERIWFIASPLGVALVLVVTPFVPLLALPFFFVFRGIRSLMTILRSLYLNDHIRPGGRATVLSAASMVFTVAVAVSREVGGVIGVLTAPLTMFGLYGGVFIVAVLILLGVIPQYSPALHRSPHLIERTTGRYRLQLERNDSFTVIADIGR